jgi:hypothetical protein
MRSPVKRLIGFYSPLVTTLWTDQRFQRFEMGVRLLMTSLLATGASSPLFQSHLKLGICSVVLVSLILCSFQCLWLQWNIERWSDDLSYAARKVLSRAEAVGSIASLLCVFGYCLLLSHLVRPA